MAVAVAVGDDNSGLWTVEYRLLDEFGTLKFGVMPEERFRTVLAAGPPRVGGRCFGWSSENGTCTVRIDLLRSLSAAAFGVRGPASAVAEGMISSKLALSRMGEVAGVELRDVINVCWPEDM
jgi:hypothetical protein